MDLGWLDIVVCVMLLGSGLAGYRRGLTREVASLVGIVLGILLAARFHEDAARAVGSEGWGESGGGRILAFLVLAGLVYLLAEMAGRVLAGGLELVRLRWLDRLAGVAFGVGRGLLVAGVLLLLADLYLPAARATIKGSSLGSASREVAGKVGSLAWEELRSRGGIGEIVIPSP